MRLASGLLSAGGVRAILLTLLTAAPAQAVKWQITLSLFPETRAETEEERGVREARLAEAKRRRRGPIASMVVGALAVGLGTALIIAGGYHPQEVSTRIDPSSGTRFDKPVHGRNNWIELGVGLPLFVFAWPTAFAQLERFNQAQEQVERYSSPP